MIRLKPIMLKILPTIPSRISQKILPLFFFIPIVMLILVFVANDLTALLEYLNVLLEHIDLLEVFQLSSAGTHVFMSEM